MDDTNGNLKAMKILNRPLAIVIVSALFILTGILGIATHTNDFNNPDIKLVELLWTLLVRILAIVCGVLLLYKIKWARWLAIVWLVYHIVIGAFNSTKEVISHTVILVIVCVLLFLPTSVDYFKRKTSSEIN
jgi:hypothetical protein